MLRLAVSLLAVAFVSTSSYASPSPRPKTPLSERMLRAAVVSKPTSVESSPARSFEITDKTEVLLDGKPCAYDQVPRTAVITYLEIARDKKLALKIHFRRK